jgi:hypothetical protein
MSTFLQKYYTIFKKLSFDMMILYKMSLKNADYGIFDR